MPNPPLIPAASQQPVFDVVIVGAGPSGLSCAIEAKKAGLSAVVLEKGSLVDYLRRFPRNVTWFSTPELLEIGGIPFVTSTLRPTRVDTLNYYQRVCRHFALDVRYFDSVEDIGRVDDRFQIQTSRGKRYVGRNVVISTGYFDHPNRLGVPGEDSPNVMHYYDEPYLYFDMDVAVIGGRNSAVEAALDLYRHGSRVTLIHRGKELSKGVKYWVLPDIENRISRGEIQVLFRTTVDSIGEESILLKTPEGNRELRHDFTFVLIGFSPDVSRLRKFGIRVDKETLAPVHNPETFETDVSGLYVAGSVVAGKYNNKVFVENGRLHGGVIVKSIFARGRG